MKQRATNEIMLKVMTLIQRSRVRSKVSAIHVYTYRLNFVVQSKSKLWKRQKLSFFYFDIWGCTSEYGMQKLGSQKVDDGRVIGEIIQM